MTLLEELVSNPSLIYRHTVGGYEVLMRTGRIEEGAPFELLDGQIVRKLRNATGEDPTTVSDHHAWVVIKLGKLSRRLEKLGCHLRTQQPILLPPFDEPEPDGAVVRGSEDDYVNRKPRAKDILCIIEVSDASLRRDRGYKQQAYARSGIPMYIIINLVNDTLEVRTNPVKDRYSDTVILKIGQKLSLPTATRKKVIVPVRQLLP